MAIINKTGIGEGNLIQAEHITRIIDALTSVSTDTVSATGSFTGSFVGNGSGLTGIVSSTATSASYAATASFLTGTISSASFASTASFVNRLVQNVAITGSLNVSGSVTVRLRSVSGNVPTANSGSQLVASDYIVTFAGSAPGVGTKNCIILPPANTGQILILQRGSGTSAMAISGSSGEQINDAAGYSFPTANYSQRTFVSNGTQWLADPN
jgi:hypothetical protein